MENSSQYCLICFTTFQQFQLEGGGVKETGIPELFRRFLLFSQQYLSVPGGSILPFLGRKGGDGVDDKGGGRVSVFCENCGAVVSSICKLYKELCEVQLQLAWKLGQLGELIGEGNNGAGESRPMTLSTLDKLGSQLQLKGMGVDGGGGGKLVEDLRSSVGLQCDRQFRNGQKLEAILSTHCNQGKEESGSIASDNVSVGICCEVEVDMASGNSNDNVESQYFSDTAAATHFLFEESSKDPTTGRGSSEDNKVKCHECHKKFAHKYSLEKHLRTVHGISTTFSCSDCNLEFSTRQQQHHHRNEFHYKRTVEGKGGSSSQKTKPRVEEAHHKCSECGTKFSSRNLLLDHMKAHRKKSKKKGSSTRRQIPANWKECQECGEGFPPNIFYYHIKRVHGQGPRHVCPEPECGKEFLFPTGLKRHLLHHGEKRFECFVCHKKFSQLPTLRKHSETQHGQILDVDKSPKSAPVPSAAASCSSYSGSGGSNDSGAGPFLQPYQNSDNQQPNQSISQGQRWVFVPSWTNYGGECGGTQRIGHPSN